MRSNREWFEIAPERVAAALRMVEIEDITPGVDYVETQDDKKALDKARARRAAFNFKMVEILPGAVLTFTRDESVTCTVVDNRRVLFHEEETSLSAAAQQALDTSRQVQGPLYWEYEGETLVERRLRMEKE